jgi:hypothetical protein
VLLSVEEYRRIAGKRRNLADSLSMPGIADVELEIPKRKDLPRVPDLS